MNRKTILALLLVLVLFIAGGCSSSDETSSEPAPMDATTEVLTAEPTEEPTAEPTEAPTAEPTEAPTAEPTEAPTEEPTAEPTEEPTAEPTEEPTAEPTEAPTAEPTEEPTAEPAAEAVAASAGEAIDATAAEADATAGEAMDEQEEQNPVLASAYDGAIEVRLEDVRETYDATLTYYVDYYTQYGYAIDEYDTDLQASVASEVIQMELTNRIALHHAQLSGYELTAEREAEIAAQVEETVAGLREYVATYLSSYGIEGEALDAMVEEQLVAAGYDYDTLLESTKMQDVVNFLYTQAIEGVTVTDEEVKAAFDEKVAQQQESYAVADTFIGDYLNGEDILYVPENMRLVHCIYIGADDLTADAYEATPAEATADEATADEATADEASAAAAEATDDEATAAEAQDIAALTGRAKADAIVAAIRGGMDFDEAMLAYSEDGGAEDVQTLGYPICLDGDDMYSEEFHAGAAALENPGDVSDVIATDYGYFILRYTQDMTAGAVDFETRKEQMRAEALASKQDEAFSAYIDAMVTDANVQIGDMSALYHVFVSESVEATQAYAAVTAETALTDMPGADAVATLAVGASLDVLGRITVDGEDYLFAAVPGTELKGFVSAADTAEMEQDAALAVDNAALATAAELPDKLPTFVIAMNDGSVIYGELYPDVAPETVGNFVTLANSGFYNGLTFHRVVAGFVIQGGDPNGDGTGGPGYAIRGEFTSNGVQNDLSHTRGVLSMARSSAPDSAGSQFFIMHADNDYLDGDYAAFGMVLGGMETVDLIASTPTNSNNVPMTDQTMREVYVQTYGQTYTFSKLED